MLDHFLPFDLEFASSAASVLVILDDVLRLVAVGPSVKRRGNRIMSDMKQRGSVPAQLRQKELDRLNRLARRLSDRRLSNISAGGRPRFGGSDRPQTVSGSAVQDLQYPVDSNDGTASAFDPRLDNSVPGQGVSLSGIPSQPLGFSSPTQTHGTTPLDLISPDLAEHFELSQEHMLFVADQLNADADDALFFSNMDFTGSGDMAGTGGNWLWSSLT